MLRLEATMVMAFITMEVGWSTLWRIFSSTHDTQEAVDTIIWRFMNRRREPRRLLRLDHFWVHPLFHHAPKHGDRGLHRPGRQENIVNQWRRLHFWWANMILFCQRIAWNIDICLLHITICAVQFKWKENPSGSNIIICATSAHHFKSMSLNWDEVLLCNLLLHKGRGWQRDICRGQLGLRTDQFSFDYLFSYNIEK